MVDDMDGMDDEELTELLRLVDEPVDDVPVAYQRRLWDELSATFDPPPTDSDGARQGASGDVVVFAPPGASSTGRGRWIRWGSLAAALVVVVAVGIVLARTGGEPDEIAEAPVSSAPSSLAGPAIPLPTTNPDLLPVGQSGGTSPPIVVLEPVEACTRFRFRIAPLVELPQTLDALAASGTADEVAAARNDIEGVRDAFDAYATDLQFAGAIEDAQVGEFGNVARTLGQAIAELDSGDLAAAARTVGVARNGAGTLLGELEVPGLRYDPFGELLIECGD